jgi:hypothetical protein
MRDTARAQEFFDPFGHGAFGMAPNARARTVIDGNRHRSASLDEYICVVE